MNNYIYKFILCSIFFVASAFIFVPKSEAAIAFRASTTGTVNGTSTLTISKPTGTLQNDVMVAAITINPNGATTPTFTPPSGWTQIQSSTNQSGTYYPTTVMFYKVAGASEGTSFSWTSSASISYGGGWIASFSGASISDPIDTNNMQNVANNSVKTTSYSTPSIITTSANEMLIVTYGGNTTGTQNTWSTPTGASAISSSIWFSGTVTSSSGFYLLQGSAGSTGAIASTSTVSSYGNSGIVALNPSQSAPTITSPTATSITTTTATLGGNVTSDGGSTITQRGVCYATNTITSKGQVGSICTPTTGTTGVFTMNFTGFSSGTTYHYVAYATNAVGTSLTTDDTFTTTSLAPTNVTATAYSNLLSYQVTMNGSVNPHGSSTRAHFRYYTSQPDCTQDSGGIRVPSDSLIDTVVGSDSSVHTFSYTVPSAVPLTRQTNYWYCAYADNDAAPGTTSTSASSGYITFTTPDGPASACDAPTSGNLTVSQSCTFQNSGYDGVDAGGNTTSNTGLLTLSTGGAVTVLPGQVLGVGGKLFRGGSFSFGNGSGSVILGAGIWLKDADGDGIIDNPIVRTVSKSQPVGYIRRNYITSLPQYSGSSYNYVSKVENASVSVLDCDSTNANIYQNVSSLVTDADHDGYKTSASAATQCVGATSTINGRTYYKDSSGNYTYLSSSALLGGIGSSTVSSTGPLGLYLTVGSNTNYGDTTPYTGSNGNEDLRLMRVYVSSGGTLTSLSGCTQNDSAPSVETVYLGLYSDNSGSPGNLIVGPVSGTISSGTTQFVTASTTPTSITAGYYWLAESVSGVGNDICADTTNGGSQEYDLSSVSSWPGAVTDCDDTNSSATVVQTYYKDNDGDGSGAAPTVQYKGGVVGLGSYSNSFSTSTSLTINAPAGLQSGVVMIASLIFANGSTDTITPPSGWTLINRVSDASSNSSLAMYWKAAGGSEPSSYTWTLGTGTHYFQGGIAAYDNVNTSSPIDTSSTNAIATSGTQTRNFVSPSITTANANELVIAVFGNISAGTFTAPSGMTERYDETTGSYGIEYNDVMQPSAGSTGTKTATTGTTGYGQSIILALNSDYAATSACLPPAGYVANSNDCNDSTSSLYQEKNAYLDIDGDGYVSISATSICSGSSLPTGFNGTVGNDCYDLNSNAHLGQTSYFSTDRGDGIYDYDCDGVATMQSPTATPCQQVGSTACSSNVCKVAGSGSPTCGSAIMSTFGGTCATDGSPFYYTASTETCR